MMMNASLDFATDIGKQISNITTDPIETLNLLRAFFPPMLFNRKLDHIDQFLVINNIDQPFVTLNFFFVEILSSKSFE